MQQPQAFAGQPEMQAQRSKHRRGIEEHRHVRRRGQLQPLGNEQELQAEQPARHHPGTPGAADLLPAPAPAQHQAHQHGGDAVAQRRLHHRRDIDGGSLDQHLLATPDQAQPQHHLQGKGIGVLADRAHRRASAVVIGMGKGSAVFRNYRLSGFHGRPCQPQNDLRRSVPSPTPARRWFRPAHPPARPAPGAGVRSRECCCRSGSAAASRARSARSSRHCHHLLRAGFR
ncbi:hypothetical protein D3C78_513420 [compost metagenome]